MTGPIAKPVMRGLHLKYMKSSLLQTVAISIATALAFKHFVMDARKKRYDEFHRTYDREAALDRMNKAGLMETFPSTYKYKDE